jgi:hypothetical protein
MMPEVYAEQTHGHEQAEFRAFPAKAGSPLSASMLRRNLDNGEGIQWI